MRLRVPLLPAAVRWTGVVGVAAFLFYVSVITVPPETVIDSGRSLVDGIVGGIALDKWRHFVGYAGLAGTLAYAVSDRPWSRRTAALVVVGTVVVYGVGIELAQAPLDQRYFSIGDAVANALGAVLVTPWFLVDRYLTFVPVGAWARGLAGGSGDR